MNKKITHWLGLTALILCLLTLAISITINAFPLYYADIDYLNILDYVEVTKETLIKNYRILMEYLNFPWVRELQMPDFPTSESGALHFYEVKRLFQLNYAVFLLTIVPSIVYVRHLVKTASLWRLIRPFQSLVTFLIALVFLMGIAFDRFFVLFHEVFFNNDAWIFDPATDPIILALPQAYFMHCFMLFFILFIGFQLFGILIAKKQVERLR